MKEERICLSLPLMRTDFPIREGKESKQKEDIPFGCKIYHDLGVKFGVPTPVIDSMITFGGTMHEKSFIRKLSIIWRFFRVLLRKHSELMDFCDDMRYRTVSYIGDNEIRDLRLFNIGHSGEVGGKYIQAKLKEKAKEGVQKNEKICIVSL